MESRPDILALPAHRRKAAIANGTLTLKEDALEQSSSRVNSPMRCEDCGTRLLLVSIVPDPIEGKPNQWHGTFWCLNGMCASFCTDVTLMVE